MFITYLADTSLLMLTLLFLVVMPATNANDQETERWNQNLLYKSTANLTCEDTSFDPLSYPGAHYSWILPSGIIIGNTSLLYQDDRYSFVNNGSTLLIIVVEKVDFGVYFCIVTISSERSVFRAIKLGINVDGPYFGDLRERYLPNLKMGFLASGVVFVVMSMFCYNHSQFQNRHDKSSKYQHSNNTDIYLKTHSDGRIMAHSNSGFEPEFKEHYENTMIDIITDPDVEPKTKL